MTATTLQQIADRLLWPCWRGMPEGYKMRYARNIWQQYEDNIKSAAYTSSLPKFMNSLCQKLGIEIRTEDVRVVNEALADSDAKAVLRAMREETTALVLMVRLKNEDRKEQFKKERALYEDL